MQQINLYVTVWCTQYSVDWWAKYLWKHAHFVIGDVENNGVWRNIRKWCKVLPRAVDTYGHGVM